MTQTANAYEPPAQKALNRRYKVTVVFKAALDLPPQDLSPEEEQRREALFINVNRWDIEGDFLKLQQILPPNKRGVVIINREAILFSSIQEV